jgi:ABC-2 type transport system ATP-binding protein
MKQKLALACTLIHTPQLLVLDEPTTGVDPVSRRDFWRILARLQREGLTLLLTTPYLDEAERCQRVALMDRGRLLNVSTPEAVKAGAKGSILEILAEPKRRAAELLQARADVSDVQVFGERLHATLTEPAGDEGRRAGEAIASELAAAGIRVESARVTSPSLEDIFIARIRATEADTPGVAS